MTPVSFTVRGAFGYDPETESAVPYFLDEFDSLPIRPWMELVVAQEDGNGTALDPCIVTLSTTQEAISEASWVTEAGGEGIVLRFGWEIPVDGTGDNCFGWDPAIWDDAEERAATFTWGLGVNELRAELASGGSDALEDAIVAESGQSEWDDNWAPFVVGGSVHWSALQGEDYPGAVTTWAYAIGQEVDDAFITRHEPPMDGREGPPVRIAASDILAGAKLPRGVYAVTLALPIDAVDLFAAQP